MKYQLIATATFGLEAVVKRELLDFGYEIIRSEDGKITYWGDEEAIVRSNLWLRTADRVYIKCAEFDALTFDDLFNHTYACAWEQIIPEDGKINVVGTSVKSELHSVPACQSIVKKAIVKRLMDQYETDNIPETGPVFTVKFTILKDVAILAVDTSGAGLHKRGYRKLDVKAPIKETLAAALVMLSFWKPDRTLVDPCCGSGTIAIEAAMIGKNIAPGLNRRFASETWGLIPDETWHQERKKALAAIDVYKEMDIRASDIDREAIKSAVENSINAGVDDVIDFKVQDVSAMKADVENGIIVTNPPYAVRVGEEDTLKHIYGVFRNFMRQNKGWSLFAITSDKTFEKRAVGRKADRRRKLYNGNIETCYYQFHGERRK